MFPLRWQNKGGSGGASIPIVPTRLFLLVSLELAEALWVFGPVQVYFIINIFLLYSFLFFFQVGFIFLFESPIFLTRFFLGSYWLFLFSFRYSFRDQSFFQFITLNTLCLYYYGSLSPRYSYYTFINDRDTFITLLFFFPITLYQKYNFSIIRMYW